MFDLKSQLSFGKGVLIVKHLYACISKSVDEEKRTLRPLSDVYRGCLLDV